MCPPSEPLGRSGGINFDPGASVSGGELVGRDKNINININIYQVYTPEDAGRRHSEQMAELRRAAPIEKKLREMGIHVTKSVPDNYHHTDFECRLPLSHGLPPFGVQVKSYNRAICVDHLKVWLQSTELVILAYWDTENSVMLWGDPLRRILRTPRWASQKCLTFSREHGDLQEINGQASTRQFQRWLAARLDLQRSFIHPRSLLVSASIFPAPLWKVALSDPSLLSLLPYNEAIVTFVRDHVHQSVASAKSANPEGLLVSALHGARLSLRSPRRAAGMLLKSIGFSAINPDLVDALAESYRSWASRVHQTDQYETYRTLWAFDRLVRMFSFKAAGDKALDPGDRFSSAYTYPLGSIAWSLDPSVVFELAASIVLRSSMEAEIRTGLHLLGLAGLQTGSTKIVQEIVSSLGKRQSDFDNESWRMIDRQSLFTQAQVGIEEAKEKLLSVFDDNKNRRFELEYNIGYFEKSPKMIANILKHRLDENRPTDVHVREIHKAEYNAYKKAIRGGMI